MKTPSLTTSTFMRLLWTAYARVWVPLVLGGALGCSSARAVPAVAAEPVEEATPAGAERVAALALEHVHVLPMTAGGAVLDDATVVIRDGRIEAVGPARSLRVPADARRLHAAGKWLLPAFADSHVHVENDRLARKYFDNPSIPDGTFDDADVLMPYVVNGVLQIANLSAMSESVGQRVAVESGRVIGPHMMLAGMIDGTPPFWFDGMTRAVSNPSDARQVVRDLKSEGYDQVKVYSMLTLDSFAAIVDEARRQGMKVVGHLPGRGLGRTSELLVPGFNMIAHAEELAYQAKTVDEADIPRYVELAKRNGTWLTATLTTDERILEETEHPETLTTRPELRYLHPLLRRAWIERNPYIPRRSPERIAYLQNLVVFNRKLVAAFAAAGIPVVAGTDSGVPGLVPGFSLHDELAALVNAGLTNQQALEAATRLPAEWLGTSADRGTVEAGKRADLVLLDASPLDNIDNTRRITAVIAGNRVLGRHELDRMLAHLAARGQGK